MRNQKLCDLVGGIGDKAAKKEAKKKRKQVSIQSLSSEIRLQLLIPVKAVIDSGCICC
jgi:hypothetical protein